MVAPIPRLLDSARLLFDLQRGSAIAQTLAGCLEPETIASRVTDGLVAHFDCALARLWIVEPEHTLLRLVASSGLYTRTDGTFARVPMGAYKVGKIAQNRVSFLSNNLAEEPWVKDRQWAIDNQIKGFAGYPLTIRDRVIGVLAVFSHHPLSLEFLEVLQFLCTTVAVMLETALRHQQMEQTQRSNPPSVTGSAPAPGPLSDQIAHLLPSVRLTLVGTEQSLIASHRFLLLQVVEQLHQMVCTYCRLIYSDDSVILEAIVSPSDPSGNSQPIPPLSAFDSLRQPVASLGGVLQMQPIESNLESTPAIQVLLKLPYHKRPSPLSDREQEIISLLAAGLRDREIAHQLFISESTVKFHINNVLNKLKVRTRYQALYQVVVHGWI